MTPLTKAIRDTLPLAGILTAGGLYMMIPVFYLDYLQRRDSSEKTDHYPVELLETEEKTQVEEKLNRVIAISSIDFSSLCELYDQAQNHGRPELSEDFTKQCKARLDVEPPKNASERTPG